MNQIEPYANKKWAGKVDYIFILDYGLSGRKQWGDEGSSTVFTPVRTRGRQAGPDLILLTNRSLQGCSYTICHKEKKKKKKQKFFFYIFTAICTSSIWVRTANKNIRSIMLAVFLVNSRSLM